MLDKQLSLSCPGAVEAKEAVLKGSTMLWSNYNYFILPFNQSSLLLLFASKVLTASSLMDPFFAKFKYHVKKIESFKVPFLELKVGLIGD